MMLFHGLFFSFFSRLQPHYTPVPALCLWAFSLIFHWNRPGSFVEKDEQKKACTTAAKDFRIIPQRALKLTQGYGIMPSMSKGGTPYNNTLAGNFVSFLNTECINCQRCVPLFLQPQRIQTKTRLTPLELRRQSIDECAFPTRSPLFVLSAQSGAVPYGARFYFRMDSFRSTSWK